MIFLEDGSTRYLYVGAGRNEGKDANGLSRSTL